MPELVACLGSGSASLEYIKGLVHGAAWEKCIIISSEPVKMDSSKPLEILVIDAKKPLQELIKELVEKLSSRIKDQEFGKEVGLNIATGSGKEHMAVLAAMLQLGLGIKLVALTSEGVREV